MKKYNVTLYYHSYIDVEVEAENEQDAIAEAYMEAGKSKYDSELLSNVQSDGDPEVEEIEEDE